MGPPTKKRSKTKKFQKKKGVIDRSSKCIEDVMRTSVILRIILQNFKNHELLKLSLVSKLWCQEARTLLRNRGSLTAVIKAHHPCQDLKAFASDLQCMNVVPFTGMKINLWSSRCNADEGCVAAEGTGLDATYDIIRARLELKNLNVMFAYFLPRFRNCPAFHFVKKLMANFGGVLETMSLSIELQRRDFIQDFLQDRSFPRLRTLRLHDRLLTNRKDCTDLIKALVSRAPNLEAFYVSDRVDLMENLMEGSSAYIDADFKVSPTVDDIFESLFHSLRLRQIELRDVRPDLRLERNMVTPMLLQLSRLTLTSVYIDAAFLVPLMGYRVCLENVTELEMHFNCLIPYQPQILSLIKTFDFMRIFPSLDTVDCFGHYEPNADLQSQILNFIEQWNPSFSKPRPDRAHKKIKELKLHLPHDRCPAAGFLPELFPHVKRIHVIVDEGPIIPRLILEGDWKDLKELEVERLESNSFRNANIDSILCGIFPEEIHQIGGKDDKYLKAVNIAPVMPSILGLKGLKDITFTGDPYVRDPTPTSACNPAFRISAVAGWALSNRFPGLVIGQRRIWKGKV